MQAGTRRAGRVASRRERGEAFGSHWTDMSLLRGVEGPSPSERDTFPRSTGYLIAGLLSLDRRRSLALRLSDWPGLLDRCQKSPG